ncbi:MAG: TIGR03619 family F420-dependent LLM class oxidoreductase [Pseudomonadales bacterium]|nr:TIGR03619 family F420-dependent LLM class oxidoreductase [Pseudomonadales bacterium]
MKFGLRYCNTGPYTDLSAATDLLLAGEEAGFDSAWTVEHTIVPAGHASLYPYSDDGKMAGGRVDIPLPDPLIWMSFLAARTSTIKLGTAILILPQHNPVVAAKQIATLDHMSNGRVLLGIGVGWLREEFDAIGADFDTRAKRTDEYIHAMRALWEQEAPTFEGDFVSFKDAYCRPQPVNGTVPIIVGGHSPAAARRAGRLGDGFFPARGVSEELVQIVRETARKHDRDPADIEVTASIPESLDDIPKLVDLGVDRIMVPVSPMLGMYSPIKTPDDVLQFASVIDSFK